MLRFCAIISATLVVWSESALSAAPSATPAPPPPAPPLTTPAPAKPAPAPTPIPAKPSTPSATPSATPAPPKPASPPARAATPGPTPLNAVPGTPKAVTPAPVDKLAEFKTAEELWAHFQTLERGPRGQGTTPAERAKAFQEFVTDLRATAELFAKKYPADPRRWEARLTADRLTQRVANAKPLAEIEKLYRETAAAADAPAEIKARARLGLIQMHREALKDEGPKEKAQAVEAEISSFAADFPKHETLPALQTSRALLWERRDHARAMTILEELARSGNADVAKEAAAQVRFRNLQREPLPLCFTALDGTPFDLAALRGKVVLVYFWASTSNVCATDMPGVVATYEKYRDHGFEIAGVSHDANKERMLAFLKEKNMTWPQYFDGKGARNPVSAGYAVRAVPAMWLVNKKGFVAYTDARGELEELVKKLLAED